MGKVEAIPYSDWIKSRMFASRHTTSISSCVALELGMVTPSKILKRIVVNSMLIAFLRCVSVLRDNVCCFDKTGALTRRGSVSFGYDRLTVPSTVLASSLTTCMISPMCETERRSRLLLGLVDGQVIVDPLDAKMYGFTRWMLEEVWSLGLVLLGERVAPKDPLLSYLVQASYATSWIRLEDAMKANGKHAHFLGYQPRIEW